MHPLHCAVGSWLAMFLFGLDLGAAELNRLTVTPPVDHGWPRLSITAVSNRVVRLETSDDLLNWSELGRSHGGLFAFPDARANGPAARFYRAQILPRTAADDWKNQVVYPDDPLAAIPTDYSGVTPTWVKFAIVFAEPHRVYFQDSTKYPFHYDFARARLAPFRNLSRQEFDAVSLREDGQQLVLGAVLFAPTDNLPEIGIQVVGNDPYPPETVARWLDLVRASLVIGPGVEVYYFPTYEQEGVADRNRSYFAQRGIAVGSPARWVVADECYAAGWALGRLVFAPAAELDAYYRDGRLRPADILLLDAVPAEVPPVAGLISLMPATPNSHVALLAQSFGIPFVYFSEPATRERLLGMRGQDVVLRAIQGYGGCELRAVSLEGQLVPEMREELLAFKAPPPLRLTPMATLGTIGADADRLRPADVRYVGGKAANFGLLRRAVPANSPTPAVAFTFDLWNAYLDQVVSGGNTLRDAIADKLNGFAWPPNMAAIKTALAQIRDLITDTADFSPAQRTAIIEVLQGAGFTADRKIRFRSSTNVEDSEQFSGAGLYDSYSGCLADDLDADGLGPSACEATEPRERGVFRALRKVYASFYNDNAFLERLRHGVDEATVGMGVLVHYSTPDELELANGVATARVYKGSQPADRGFSATLVTQAGAVSVANPAATARPEEVQASIWSGSVPYVTLQRASSLVPLGGHVLAWDQEYQQLTILLDAAARAYEAEFPSRKQFLLDFEYKKVAPDGRLRVKQIREVPDPSGTESVVPWLLNETNRCALAQGEYGDVFGFHRLKSWWWLPTANRRLLDANLGTTVYGAIAATLLDGLTVTNVSGPLAGLPGFVHGREEDELVDAWTMGAGAGRRTFALRTWLPRLVTAVEGPIVFLSDGQVQLRVTYTQPQPVLGFEGPTTTLEDQGLLAPVTAVTPLSQPQSRTMQAKGLTVHTRFYWPPPPAGPVAGYTAPLQAWIETRIEGLLATPIVLRGELSQTYHPGHHNFYEEFLFDPHLEPGMDPAVLAQLTALNIRAIYGAYAYETPATFGVLGLDNKLRPL